MPDRGEGASVGEPGHPDGGVAPGAGRGETERSITSTPDEHHGAKSPHCQCPPAVKRGPQLRPQPAESTAERDCLLRAAGPLAGPLHGEHLLGEPASPIDVEAESRAAVRSHALHPRVSHASHEREEHHQHRWYRSDSSTSIGKYLLSIWSPAMLPSLVSKTRPPIPREESNL